MIVGHAKSIARQWVMTEGAKIHGFFGAYYAGSITTFPDAAELPASSDVDVKVVLSSADQMPTPKKFAHRGVILEVSYTPYGNIDSPEKALGNYHIAGAFSTPSVIADPSGKLTDLQEAVSKEFAKRHWVYRRCEDARNNTRRFLKAVNDVELHHDQVTCWLFGAAGTTHILLTAGLRNPTVRRRYMAARELLSEYGYLEFYEALLSLLGCAEMGKERVEYHLDAVTKAFDTAKTIVKTPYRFASDISDTGRPISIGGSRELIERGFHREAVYWLVATYSRCQAIFHNDAPLETQERFSRGFRELIGDLGITSFADLQRRSEGVEQFLPKVWDVAESIIAANPEIEG